MKLVDFGVKDVNKEWNSEVKRVNKKQIPMVQRMYEKLRIPKVRGTDGGLRNSDVRRMGNGLERIIYEKLRDPRAQRIDEELRNDPLEAHRIDEELWKHAQSIHKWSWTEAERIYEALRNHDGLRKKAKRWMGIYLNRPRWLIHGHS